MSRNQDVVLEWLRQNPGYHPLRKIVAATGIRNDGTYRALRSLRKYGMVRHEYTDKHLGVWGAVE